MALILVAAVVTNSWCMFSQWRLHVARSNKQNKLKFRCPQKWPGFGFHLLSPIVCGHAYENVSFPWSNQHTCLLMFLKRPWFWLWWLSLIVGSCIQGHIKRKRSVNAPKQSLISAANPVINNWCIAAPRIASSVPIPKAHVCISCLKRRHAFGSDICVVTLKQASCATSATDNFVSREHIWLAECSCKLD